MDITPPQTDVILDPWSPGNRYVPHWIREPIEGLAERLAR